MSAEKTTIPFNGTKEQEEQLLKVIAAHKGQKGALMPVLQQAQEIYGYLPIEVQQIISDEMQIPMSKIFGVVTFYSFYSLQPKGKYKISVCLGTACYVKGAQKLLDRLVELLGIQPGECTPDGKFSIEACRCIGACGLAPVLTVNEDVYGKITAADVKGILDKYR